MEDTETIFWSNLEAGLSLLAVNLPSLWAYVNKPSPESIINSIRSAISLRSFRSGGSLNHTHVRIPGNAVTAVPPDSSQTRIVTGQEEEEAHAMHDIEKGDPLKRIPSHGIVVKQTLTRFDEMV